MSPLKRFYFDLETTGTNPHKHGFFQLAAIIEMDGQIKEELNFWCVPDGEIDKKTMEFHGLEMNEFEKEKYLPQRKLYSLLRNVLSKYVDKFDKRDKFHMVGYNSHSFDVPFLRRFFENCGDKFFGSYFWHPSIDVMLLWADALQERRHTIANFKNSTLAKFLDITVDEEKLHEASYDIAVTRELYLLYRQHRPMA